MSLERCFCRFDLSTFPVSSLFTRCTISYVKTSLSYFRLIDFPRVWPLGKADLLWYKWICDDWQLYHWNMIGNEWIKKYRTKKTTESFDVANPPSIKLWRVKGRGTQRNMEEEKSINNLVRRRKKFCTQSNILSNRGKFVWFCSTGFSAVINFPWFIIPMSRYWKTFCQKQRLFVTIMKAWCMMLLLINELKFQVSLPSGAKNSFVLQRNKFLKWLMSINETFSHSWTLAFHLRLLKKRWQKTKTALIGL